MAAHDDERDLGQPGAGHGAYDGGECDGAEYGGSDALMAALLDEPLPAGVREDPVLLAAHGAAVADLAVLREQLALIGDALAAPDGAVPTGAEDGDPAERGGAARSGKRPEPGDGAGRPGAGTRAPVGADPGEGRTGNDGAGGRSAPRTPPEPHSPCPRGSRGPHRARRPLRTALGALAAAAAATLAVGVGGWLVAQGGGAPGASADSKAMAPDSAADRQEGGAAFGSPHYLACARLVAEGTVLTVRPEPGSGRERITLGVTRVYKGEGGGGDRVVFVLDGAGRPRLSGGDRVLVGLPFGGDHPDTLIVGEEDIAPERPRITAALPESRTLTCG